MIRKPQKIFAHLELLPKADCKFGVRVRKLTALSEDGREFYALPDQAHYQESVRKVRSDFLAFCRACGVERCRGEVWVTECISKDAGAVLPCPDCSPTRLYAPFRRIYGDLRRDHALPGVRIRAVQLPSAREGRLFRVLLPLRLF